MNSIHLVYLSIFHTRQHHPVALVVDIAVAVQQSAVLHVVHLTGIDTVRQEPALIILGIEVAVHIHIDARECVAHGVFTPDDAKIDNPPQRITVIVLLDQPCLKFMRVHIGLIHAHRHMNQCAMAGVVLNDDVLARIVVVNHRIRQQRAVEFDAAMRVIALIVPKDVLIPSIPPDEGIGVVGVSHQGLLIGDVEIDIGHAGAAHERPRLDVSHGGGYRKHFKGSTEGKGLFLNGHQPLRQYHIFHVLTTAEGVLANIDDTLVNLGIDDIGIILECARLNSHNVSVFKCATNMQ